MLGRCSTSEGAYELSFRLVVAWWRRAEEADWSILEATRVHLADGCPRNEDCAVAERLSARAEPPLARRRAAARLCSSSASTDGECERVIPSDLERPERLPAERDCALPVATLGAVFERSAQTAAHKASMLEAEVQAYGRIGLLAPPAADDTPKLRPVAALVQQVWLAFLDNYRDALDFATKEDGRKVAWSDCGVGAGVVALPMSWEARGSHLLLCHLPTTCRSVALVGNVLSAVFIAHRVFQLAGHSMEVLHAVVETVGMDMQDLLRRGFGAVGLISSAARGLRTCGPSGRSSQ